MDICVIVGVIACTDATLSELKIEFDVMEKCSWHYVCTRLQKRKLFRQRRLKHSGVGGATAFRRVDRTRAFTTLAVLVVNMRVRKKL